VAVRVTDVLASPSPLVADRTHRHTTTPPNRQIRKFSCRPATRPHTMPASRARHASLA
jgi:hypothetical protein